jgi:putative membrane-bound dehydrogenase-like protein
MTLADGLRVALFASEPEVRQPILVKVDDRGRLWTIQYLQYPNPAGLTRVSVDRWSRTVYDRVPEPPPRGPRGADRITILQDTDGDGRADVVRDFVDGLNLATGLAFGHGGVYVLQVPYLLFYPDRDRDDVPDSDPQVLLKGFGMEDAQSLANHLTWGPDGWLYGVNGSTTTCNIRGIEFQQGVWRYHPLRDEFELFCEGGGNTFGLTFDERGDLFYSTNGGPFVHAMQGAYYRKSFGKHGPLHNLYAYSFFEVVERDQVPGGPPTGGTIYLAGAFPSRLRGTFIAGNFLGHTASWWDVAPIGSTFRATYGGVLLDSHDTWFGPTDMCVGPAGEMYLSDFCDQRTAHPDPDANWDRSNGRLYRITANGAPPADDFDLAALSSAELVELLRHPNRWYADRARVELAARCDPSVLPALRELAVQQDNELTALQGLWALHVSGGFDDAIAETLLAHPSESVRAWTVRLLGDRKSVSPAISNQLTQLACGEKSPVVRCQLAASARRLPAADAIPMLAALLESIPQDKDSRTPWMIWWGIESHAIDGRKLLLASFDGDTAWSTASRRMQTRLLIRRGAAAGTKTGYAGAQRLLASAPVQQRDSAFAALADGLAERAAELGDVEQGGLFEQFAVVDEDSEADNRRSVEPVTGALLEDVRDYWRESADNADRLRLALLCGIDDAQQRLLDCITTSPSVDHLQLLLEFGHADCVPLLLPLLQTPDEARLAALIQVLGRFGGAETTQALLNAYPDLPDGLQSQVVDVLLRRPGSAVKLLEEVGAESISKDDISTSQLRAAAIHNDDRLNGLIHKLWGNIAPGTPEEQLATMRRFNNDLRAGSGEPARGKALFTRHCATCHVLFGEGGKVGPDLTTANRGDRAALLANIVAPSAVVRREYINYTVATGDGRVLTGLLAEQDAAGITILDAKNQRTRLRREEIDDIREADVSLMPERLLEQLTPQELRDLFAYLQQQAAP